MGKAYGSRDLTDTLQDILTGIGRFVLGAGALAMLIGIGLLVWTCFKVSSDPTVIKAAVANVATFQQLLVVGSVAVAVGVGYLFWGEDIASAILVVIGAGLYFAPMYMPMVLGSDNGPSEVVGAALGGLQQGGMVLGILAILTLAVDVGIKVRERAKIGVKADQLKFGKGIKEEADRQNVFMGNCWQLPYCRKFVRERCPIFHAKRTCWKERTGCMCEEEVIRNAMENKPIPKDALLAAKMIPRNHRLNEQQKIERCKNCVIYNEHQRHKYRLWLPIMLLLFVGFYAAAHGTLIASVRATVDQMTTVISHATLTAHTGTTSAPPEAFLEGLLFVGMLIALSYSLKLLEFLIFKLKI